MAQNAATRGAARIVENGHFRMNWNTGKLEPCKARPELPKGTIVHAYGGYMSYSRFATTGNGAEVVMLSQPSEEGYFGPFAELDDYARPVSEKFGIGLYYDLEATPATDDEISAAIERGHAFERRQEEAKEAAAREWRQALEEVRQQYAGTFRPIREGTWVDAAHVARNIRQDLALHFPGVRFSVRKDGCDAVRIEWADGPTQEEVEAVTGKHEQACERDPWNDDLYDHKDTPFTAVFGGVRYISHRRNFSPAVYDAKKAEIEALCPDCKGQGFHRNSINEHPDFWKLYELDHELSQLCWINADSVARFILDGTSLYAAPEKRHDVPTGYVVEMPDGTLSPLYAESIADGLRVVDYSEKAFAVVGDTKPHADTFKRLGGCFNARLSCGAGWIFSKSKEGALREALGLSAE